MAGGLRGRRRDRSARRRRVGCRFCKNRNHRSGPMAVSQSASCSSIDLAGLPARVLEALSELVAVCREPLASAPCAAAFEEAELRVRESVNALGCEVLGAWVEGLDDGALRIERAGQCWFRAPAPAFARAGCEDDHEPVRPGDLQPGALSPRREPALACAGGREPGAGERLPDAPARPARADDEVCHGTAREAEAFFSEMGAMRPACPCEDAVMGRQARRFAFSASREGS